MAGTKRTADADAGAPPFHVLLGDRQLGPLSRAEVDRLIASDRLRRETYVWAAGMKDWERAGQCAVFLQHFGQALQPAAPPPRSPAPAAAPRAANPAPAQLRPRQAPMGGPESPRTEYPVGGVFADPARGVANETFFEIDLPAMGAKQRLSFDEVRDPKENIYLTIIWGVNGLVGLGLIAMAFAAPEVILVLLAYTVAGLAAVWINWKLLLARLLGHCIEVGPRQYPQIHSVIRQAADYLAIPVPQVFVMQGHGMFEIFVAKLFSRNGVIILTSNLIDEFAKKPTSREFMMFVGRQLGHIKAGHFRLWFFKNVIGLGALFFWSAWRRHCHITADRIGLLCAGNLYAAEQALLMITVGTELAPGTNFDAVQEQRERLSQSFWAWLQKIFSTYPHMVVRLVRLREFASMMGLRATAPDAPTAIGALPIAHTPLRSMPILVIHGHDRLSLLELQNLLLQRFPHIIPRVMVAEQIGTLGMAEKFERISGDLVGAIALMTPDDKAVALNAPGTAAARARQNVVMEIGWVWGKLGRQKCLLMKRGDVEVPSDLAGVDVLTFRQTPSECLTAIHAFIEHLGQAPEAAPKSPQKA